MLCWFVDVVDVRVRALWNLCLRCVCQCTCMHFGRQCVLSGALMGCCRAAVADEVSIALS